MKWIVVVMVVLWALVMWGAVSERQWTTDGEQVTIVKMGAKP